MFNKDSSYILIDTNSFNFSSIQSRLLREDFTYFSINNYASKFPTFIVETSNYDLNDLALDFLDYFKVEKLNSLYIKKKNDTDILYRLGMKTGKFKAELGMNETCTNYIDNYNKFFHLTLVPDFIIVESVSQIKEGMTVQVKNNEGVWINRIVKNENEEWSKIYSTLSKFGKLRIQI